MSVHVTTISEAQADDWNQYVDQARYTTPFHRYEALTLLAAETNAELHLLVGFKGQEPVGILPVFEKKQGPFLTVISPPELEVFTLGPALLNAQQLKQRKTERRHRQFIEQSVEWIDDLNPDYVDIRTVDRYTDTRPFIWSGFDVGPAYTYIVDLTMAEDDLLMSFSRDARSNIRAAADEPITIEEGDRSAIREIITDIQERLTDQGVAYPLTPGFVEALYDTLPDGVIRVYTVNLDGTRISGMITLEHADTVYRWQGGAKTGDNPSVNDVLDWEIIRNAKTRGFTRYDLVGANSARLSRYKSKFNPVPSPYYIVKRRSNRMRAVLTAYHAVPEPLRVF